MFSQKLLDAMNEQMKNEFLSAYLYLAMAGYFEAEDLPGISSWMRVQAMEELTHGEKFFHFLCEAGGRAAALSCVPSTPHRTNMTRLSIASNIH